MARRIVGVLVTVVSLIGVAASAEAAVPAAPDPALVMPALLVPSLAATCPAEPVVLVAAAEGPVKKTLAIDSDPPGAEVFLKQGSRETKLGTTPLNYEAEFHSAISILRMVFKKKGFQPATLEVSASQDTAVAKLAAVEVVANPTKQEDPKLRALQERVNPVLDREMKKFLDQPGPFQFDVASPLQLVELEGETSLMVTLILNDAKNLPQGSGKEKQGVLSKTLWSHLGKHLVMPLAAELRGEKDLGSIVMQVAYDERRVVFGVGTKMETKMQMKCMPGTTMQLQMVPCASMVGGRCSPGTALRPTYSPCAYIAPVYTQEMKADPKTGFVRDQARAQYVVPLLLLRETVEPDDLYAKIGVLLTDSKGELVEQHGAMPETILAAKDPKSERSENGLSERLNQSLKAAGFEFKAQKGESAQDRSERFVAIARALDTGGQHNALTMLLREIADEQVEAKLDNGAWAPYALGLSYLKGTRGMPVDFEQAFQWIRKGALGGNHDAMYRVSLMYGKGLGTEKDVEQARIWLARALEKGKPNPKDQELVQDVSDYVSARRP